MSVVIIDRPRQIIEWEVYCQDCDRILATVGSFNTAHDLRMAHEDKLHLRRRREPTANSSHSDPALVVETRQEEQ